MKIDRLELRLLRLPLVRFFETSFARTDERAFLLVSLGGEGMAGLGECVAEEYPYYSSETTGTAWHVITEFIAPRILGREFSHPRDVYAALTAIRGHNMAKASVEMAAWDLFARQRGEPLWRVLGGNGAPIAAGVSIGIQGSLDELSERVTRELEAGYRRVKIKIKPGWDLAAVERVRSTHGDIPLMVDANAAYRLDDRDHLVRLDAFGLMMIEQPLDYDDITDHAVLQRHLHTPLCLDESIHSVRACRDALANGACRVVNIKPGRVGGHGESIRVHDLCQVHDVPVWHGGMLESGVGRAHNLHLSTLPNFRLPGDIAASARYFAPDIIEPPIEVLPDGTVPVPSGPGIGVTVIPDRVARATQRCIEMTKP